MERDCERKDSEGGACDMWAGRQGSGQLRGLVSTGWTMRPGLYWFRQLECPVLSPVTTSFSDPTNVPTSVSLHGSEACPDLPPA